jgi:hypothetical protein
MKADHKYYGIYRALVVNNKDPQKTGRVMVWVPDVMPEVSQSEGMWAKAANNVMGGRNSEYGSDNNYTGSCYIPKKGSYVLVFFESGNLNNPCYIGAIDLENTKVLPENQTGGNPTEKWTIFKSSKGRCIVMSDDPDDERVEITGKKRQLGGAPSGDTGSVFTIDGNQTTILLDERPGMEKVLIRTHKGDFINIDVENRKLHMKFKSDINIETEGNLNLKIKGNFVTEVNGDKSEIIAGNYNTMTGGTANDTSSGNKNIKGSVVAIDGSPSVIINSGAAASASTNNPESPIGVR